MIEVTQYQCEVCKKYYTEREQCEECEASHVAVDSVTDYRYLSKDVGPECKYPCAVTVKMADGSVLVYKGYNV